MVNFESKQQKKAMKSSSGGYVYETKAEYKKKYIQLQRPIYKKKRQKERSRTSIDVV